MERTAYTKGEIHILRARVAAEMSQGTWADQELDVDYTPVLVLNPCVRCLPPGAPVKVHYSKWDRINRHIIDAYARELTPRKSLT